MSNVCQYGPFQSILSIRTHLTNNIILIATSQMTGLYNDRMESAIITGSCSSILYSRENFNCKAHITGRRYILQPGRYNAPIS